MRKIILFAITFFFIAALAYSQPSIRAARKSSWHCLVYRISADTAEKYISSYIISPQRYLDQIPFATWHADTLKYEELPAGNYLLLSVAGNELVAEYYCQSNLRVLPVNNQHRVQLEVKDSTGSLVSYASVWVNKKQLKYQDKIKGFELKQRKADEAIIRIAVPGDTLFMELSAREDVDKNGWQQWWKNFSYTKVGSVVTWPVRKVRRLFTLSAGQWFRKKYRSRISGNGYMIFNKPKYLPGDTVKLKAYILNKKGKQYKKRLDMYLEYSANGRAVNKSMGPVKPTTPGAFLYEFVLGDSLESDRTYNIVFKNKKGHTLLRNSFKIEDYLLDEVATYHLRAAKENYFPHDTLVFYTNARDANGLSLMDGRVQLYLLTKSINGFYNEREFVPDTLWKGEKLLLVEGDTKFEIPARSFPDADLSIRVVAEFRNSNNEIQEEETSIDFMAKKELIKVREDGNYIIAEYMKNGVSVDKEGFLSYDEEDKERKIHFPYRQKIDTYVEEYSFWTEDANGKISTSEYFETDRDYSLAFSRIRQNDTTGFYLYNPKKIPVHYTVFNGKRIMASTTDTAEWISWKKIVPAKKIYNVQWSYIWKGRENKRSNTIAFLDKILDTKISSAGTIYPGQTDTISVVVKDYKGNPAANVNLTAVSYNSQFKKDIRVNEPPYIQKFSTKRRILFDNYEIDDAMFTRRLLLGKHQQWRNKFGLDSMRYYQLLFPDSGYVASSSLISEFSPQLAVHVVEKGVPQEIYMLYINREFAWYNGVTDRSNYAFSVLPGYTQIGIRVRNKYIEIDSMYLQPFYKHDISFDLAHLPAGTKVEERNEYYTQTEKNQIERQIWQLQNDSRTNFGYVWQNNKLVYIGTNNRNHLIGPFGVYDSLQFYKPGDFDSRLSFEPGYEYRLTPKMARLEGKSIFPGVDKVLLPKIDKTTWVLGDTVAAQPVISYEKKPSPKIFLRENDNGNWYSFMTGVGSLKIELPTDSSFIYAVLYSELPDTTIIRIRSYQPGMFNNLTPGKYNLVLVTKNFHYLSAENLSITAGGAFCLRFDKPVYSLSNFYVEELVRKNEERAKKDMQKYFEQERETKKQEVVSPAMSLPKGNGIITGIIADKKGKSPIPGAVVAIKGYSAITSADADGSYSIRNIRPGNYVLFFSSVGYESKEVRVTVADGTVANVSVQLSMMDMALSEVVVVGYGTMQRKSVTGSISKVSGAELTSVLMGRVPGVNIDGQTYNDSPVIRIRGMNSLKAYAKPLYVINGVPMEALPEGFDMEKVQISILNDASAVSLYGSRAANGVIIITTPDFMPKNIRDTFRDYAFWQPNLFTNEKGEVKFPVTYPDNITGWQTYVVGMDKKRRFTKATMFVKSFKPVLGQLSAPQFLIEGDTSAFIGKAINYTETGMTVTTDFSLNGKLSHTGKKELSANGVITDALSVVAVNTDTINAQYAVTTSSGYKDGELRKVPVFKKGVEETIGDFWILGRDTSFSFSPDKNAGDITFYAQNNTLDVLLDEIKNLKEYPYYCMEQTASKLTGLLMEKKIREALKEPFKGDKDIQKLLGKLQKEQLFNGGWSWWEGGTASWSITNYIIRALLPLRKDALVESNIRNALLYLHNNLPLLKEDQLPEALFTLSEAGHYMDYASYLNKVVFDSLSIHQQWLVVRIRQQQKLEYGRELKTVIDKRIETMPGGVHWGQESFFWESNSMATTALAFTTLSDEKNYQSYLKQMIQFFLERRKPGRWRNTVESASVLSTILPFVLKDNAMFTERPLLLINGRESIRVDSFPFTRTITNSVQPVTIARSGGGLIYLTAWQKLFNKEPEPVMDKFVIDTWFERTGNRLVSLKAGEKVTMKIRIEVVKDAEYVQVEIPVPAGCTYAEKKQAGWKMHSEFLKNKTVLFIEKMNKGVYHYEIELEPRYPGTYQLNPVKAELMYFPVFYGRNEMKKATVSN